MSPWVQLYNLPVDLEQPDLTGATIDMIATALSRICRFSGNCRQFYSVAQHSVAVSHLVPIHQAREALMHDAHEAIIGDITTPVARMIEGDEKKLFWLKARIDNAIRFRWNLGSFETPEIHRADAIMLATEREWLMMSCIRDWELKEKPRTQPLKVLTEFEAKAEFLARWQELCL